MNNITAPSVKSQYKNFDKSWQTEKGDKICQKFLYCDLTLIISRDPLNLAIN